MAAQLIQGDSQWLTEVKSQNTKPNKPSTSWQQQSDKHLPGEGSKFKG